MRTLVGLLICVAAAGCGGGEDAVDTGPCGWVNQAITERAKDTPFSGLRGAERETGNPGRRTFDTAFAVLGGDCEIQSIGPVRIRNGDGAREDIHRLTCQVQTVPTEGGDLGRAMEAYRTLNDVLGQCLPQGWQTSVSDQKNGGRVIDLTRYRPPAPNGTSVRYYPIQVEDDFFWRDVPDDAPFKRQVRIVFQARVPSQTD